MKLLRVVLPVVCLLLLWSGAVSADDSGRIYGRITTVDGDELEGFIRWDKNEGSWVDKLDGTKEIPKKNRRDASRTQRRKYRDRDNDRKVKIFGVTVYDDAGSSYRWTKSAESGVMVGHVKTLEVLGDNEALIVFKSGEEIEFTGGSTDIGDDIREIVIEDKNEGELELVWDDIEIIEFFQAPSGEESSFGERLFGTLTTRRGDTYTGFVCWDIDEIFGKDILDGEERRRTRRIKFDKIAAIERYSSSGATVILKSGDEMVLRETNDVNDSNKGILICDPALGQVRFDWDEFDRVDFQNPPSGVKYSEYDGGRLLQGTVWDEDGEKFTGTIRWDNDEEYTWELLDGDNRGVEFDIEFGNIKSIEKKSSRGSIVTLWDDREIRLRDSNDVDDDNKGIWIFVDGGDEVVLDWDEFAKIEFDK